jgi:hypothetical protein
MIARVIANFNGRVANVIQQRGAWIEHITNQNIKLNLFSVFAF